MKQGLVTLIHSYHFDMLLWQSTDFSFISAVIILAIACMITYVAIYQCSMGTINLIIKLLLLFIIVQYPYYIMQ